MVFNKYLITIVVFYTYFPVWSPTKSICLSIIIPGIYFKIKSNLDRYNTHFSCFLFNFCTFIKYFRFL